MRHLRNLFIAILLGAALLAAPVSFAGEDHAAAPNGGVLRVNLIGLRSNNGKVHCTLYNQADAFPDNDSKALKEADAPIKEQSATCTFAGLAPGKYALVAFHDENNNGKFDENALGMPEEGYAFSNNVKPVFSEPKFDECAFDYGGGDQSITISMIY